ncbi:hypothetical protein L3Q82_023984 [Scortum barcoo]|uniref:Uncharacterized protein n=1 Tax=Scortum barcoo TaxID=214431 RepID=A0ACB8WUH4_9TELE|nr:hypothetical protein L3Q82_023984 [Scortum barcoo]
MNRRTSRTVTSPGLALPGPHPGEPGLGLGLQGERLVAESCPRDPAGLSPKWRNGVGPPSSRLTTRRKVHEGSGRLRGTKARDGRGTSTHSLGSGTTSSLRGAGPSTTLELPRVSGGELVWACHSSQLSRHVLEFTPVNERVASLRYGLGIGLLLLFVPTGRTAHKGVHQCTWHQDTLGRRSDD